MDSRTVPVPAVTARASPEAPVGDGAGRGDARSRRIPRYAKLVLSVTTLGVLLTGLAASSLTVALPVVVRHFHASPRAANWLLLSYMLVTTVLILSFGRLADIVGRRRLYIAGLGLFTLASFAAGLAPNTGVLMGMRTLQAVGAAAIITNTTALLTDAFPPHQLALGIGLNLTIISAAQTIGPVVGGLAATLAGWRAVFWINMPVGVAGVVWASVVLRRPARRTGRESFDLVGAALSFGVIGTLVLTLSEGGALGWTSGSVLAGAAGFLACAPLFLWWQWRRPAPLVDLSLFADRERAMGYLASLLVAIARFAVVLLVSLYVQATRGLDPFQAGLQVLPIAVGIMLASPVAGRLALRIPLRRLAATGLVITVVSLGAMALTVAPDRGYPLLPAQLFAVGIGSGLFLAPNSSSIMARVPAARRGIANGVRSMIQNTGYLTSTALSLAIVTSSMPAAQKAMFYSGDVRQLTGSDLGRLTGGYRLAFALLALLAAAALLVSLLRPGPPADVPVEPAPPGLPE